MQRWVFCNLPTFDVDQIGFVCFMTMPISRNSKIIRISIRINYKTLFGIMILDVSFQEFSNPDCISRKCKNWSFWEFKLSATTCLNFFGPALWHGANHFPLAKMFAGPQVEIYEYQMIISEEGAGCAARMGISKLNATWRSLQSGWVWCRPNWVFCMFYGSANLKKYEKNNISIGIDL